MLLPGRAPGSAGLQIGCHFAVETGRRRRWRGGCAAQRLTSHEQPACRYAQDAARLGQQFDPAGRAILAYLAENGHARIRELADLIGANSDMDVLYAIRQSINPTAQELLRRPVLFFVESQLDQVTGEMIAYAWWLAGSKGRSPAAQAVEAEVYDEGETIAVVLDLCGAEERSICRRAEGRRLIVTAEGEGRRWCSEVELPAPVNPSSAVQQYRNGILSIKLAKMER